jgi:hypothetical protein
MTVLDDRELLDVLDPFTLWCPPGESGSFGPAICRWAAGIGIPLDLEQQRDIEVLTRYGPDGNWLTLEGCIIEGRQNGKTKAVLLTIALAALFLFRDEPDRIVWTSHLMKTSLDTFERVKELIKANPSLARRVERISESKSEQGIYLFREPGQVEQASLEFLTRSVGGGRGLGGKLVVFDEALFLDVAMIGALLPTLSARGDGTKVLYGSSAGLARSTQLRALLRRGRAGGDPSLTLIEYRAPGSWRNPGCAPDEQRKLGARVEKCTHLVGAVGCVFDREDYWRRANHAMRRGRITARFVAAERRTLCQTPEGVIEFGRERLGWEEEGDDALRLIPLEDWDRTKVPAGFSPGRLRRPCFYLDVAPAGGAASIGVAADREDRSGAHVGLASHRIGSTWLVARAVELLADRPGAVFAASTTGGIAAHLPALDQAGIRVWAPTKEHPLQPRGTIRLFTDKELAAACAHLQNLATQRPYRMTHADNKLVITALKGAAKRDLGDGMWIWTRKGEQLVELSPLYGITGALWLLETTRPGDYDIGNSVH